jgi:hypothetical protein
MSATTASPGARPILPALRWLLAAATVLSFGAGFSLSVLTEKTDRYFSWTIASPITAATLGAGFWFGTTLVGLALRERAWVNARVAVPGVILFSAGMLAATLIHLDKFHTGSATGVVWVAVYIVVPPALLALLLLQLRAPGSDPPRQHRLPLWLRPLLAMPAAVLVVVGAGLFVAPATFDGLWPWPLTPLTARAIGTGFAALGLIVTQMAWEDNLERDRIGFAALAVLGALQLVALLRYSGDVDWDTLQAWVYLAGLVGAVAIGASGWLLAARESQRIAPA